MKRMLAPTASCLLINGRATPARMAPMRGAKTAINVNMSTLHQCHVLDLDRATVTEIDNQNGETDRGLGGGYGKYEHGENLADHVMQSARESDEIEIGRQQNKLDRHHDDDDVLSVHENA